MPSRDQLLLAVFRAAKAWTENPNALNLQTLAEAINAAADGGVE